MQQLRRLQQRSGSGLIAKTARVITHLTATRPSSASSSFFLTSADSWGPIWRSISRALMRRADSGSAGVHQGVMLRASGASWYKCLCAGHALPSRCYRREGSRFLIFLPCRLSPTAPKKGTEPRAPLSRRGKKEHRAMYASEPCLSPCRSSPATTKKGTEPMYILYTRP